MCDVPAWTQYWQVNGAPQNAGFHNRSEWRQHHHPHHIRFHPWLPTIFAIHWGCTPLDVQLRCSTFRKLNLLSTDRLAAELSFSMTVTSWYRYNYTIRFKLYLRAALNASFYPGNTLESVAVARITNLLDKEVSSKCQTPLHGHRLWTCYTTPPTDKNLPHRNARAQHLDTSRRWDVANFCPLVVNLLYNKLQNCCELVCWWCCTTSP